MFNVFLNEKNPTLAQILGYIDKNLGRKELTISFKAESVEFIVSSLATQSNFIPDVVCIFENVERVILTEIHRKHNHYK